MNKKILYYSDCPFFAGCEKVVKNLISSNEVRKRFKIYFMFRKSKRYLNDLEKINFKNEFKKIPLSILSFDYIYFKYVDSKNIFINLKKISLKLFEIILFFQLINFIILLINVIKVKPDILHINNGGYPGAKSSNILVLVCKILNIKLIYTVNNIAVKKNFFYYPIGYFKDLIISYTVKFFITSSVYAANKLKNRVIFDNKVISIKNCIDQLDYNTNQLDFSEYKKNNDTKILLSAGLLVERKGFMNLLKSILVIKEQYKNFFLLICGEGNEYNKLKNFIEKNNIQKYVKLIGHKNNLLDYINSSDIFILPSIKNEDSPYVIIEALMLGKPIISTNVSGIPEMVDNDKNGYLVKPNSVNSLSKSIIKILNLDKKKLNEFSKRSKYIYSNKFSYDKNIKEYINIYDYLLSKN